MPMHTLSPSTHAQPPIAAPTLKVKTRLKAGGLSQNHNETLVKVFQPTQRLTVKTQI